MARLGGRERTLYDILMVSPQADREVIGIVYRHLAKRYHPDRDPSPEAERRMAELNDAYAILSDPVKRRGYDERTGLRPPSAPPVVPGDSRPARRGAPNTTASADSGPYGEAGAPPPNVPPQGNPLTFGRYRGWTLNQVARTDFDYIEWLSRTTMGRNYRRQLDDLLRTRRR